MTNLEQLELQQPEEYDVLYSFIEEFRKNSGFLELDIQGFLDDRWNILNMTNPPWSPDYTYKFLEESTESDDVLLIETSKIVRGGFENQWGQVNNRPGQYKIICNGILSQPAEKSLDTFGAVSLTRYEGPKGPVYEIGSDGRHRLHTAKAIGLPFIPAIIKDSYRPMKKGKRTRFTVSKDRHSRKLERDHSVVAVSSPYGVFHELSSDTHPWDLEPPARREELRQHYSTVYPD